MHINAVGAAVDLRGPQLHQVLEPVLQPAAVEVDLQAEHGPDGAGGRLPVIELWLHRHDSLNRAAGPQVATRMVRGGGAAERATRVTWHGVTSMPKKMPIAERVPICHHDDSVADFGEADVAPVLPQPLY